MNKKLLIVLVLLLTLTLVGCKKENEEPKKDEPKVEEKSVLELDKDKDLVESDIESLETVKYTEGGDNRETTTDKTEIARVYNMLSKTKIADETDSACDDNTTVYILKTKDKSYSFEFECSWFVYNGKRYNVAK